MDDRSLKRARAKMLRGAGSCAAPLGVSVKTELAKEF